MVKLFSFRRKFTIIGLFLLACVFACASLFAANTTTASAEYSVTPQPVLPATAVELKDLSDPKDAYWSDDYSAIVEGANTLLIYSYASDSFTELSNFTSLRRIRRLNERYLVVSDFGILYSIDLENGYSVTEMHSFEGTTISGNYFDICDNTIITSFNKILSVYQVDGNDIVFVRSLGNINADSPIALNSDTIFYVSDTNRLCKCDYMGDVRVSISNDIPTDMIVDNDNLYYIFGNSIYRYSLTGVSTKLTVIPDESYQLGNVYMPVSIAFKGENLLIVDKSLNSAEEFKISNGKLIFTGFAVAKDKTAFNRISANNTAISSYGNTVCVLDENKVTSMVGNEFYSITIDRIKDICIEFEGEFEPDLIACSDSTCLIGQRNEKKICLFDIRSGEIIASEIVDDGIVVSDAVFSSGLYYLLILDNPAGTFSQNSFVFSYDQQFERVSETPVIEINEYVYQDVYPLLAVDVDKNVYITNPIADKIYKFDFENDYARSEIAHATCSGIISLSTDISCKLYALYSNKVISYGAQSTVINISFIGYEGEPCAVTDMAMDFMNKDVYFIFDGQEYVCKTNRLPNTALSEIAVPSSYITKGSNADITKLKIYTEKENANLYCVDVIDGEFVFSGLYGETIELFKICSFTYADEDYTVLSGETTIIAKTKHLTEITGRISETGYSVFVSADVCAYYLPFITDEDTFVLETNSTVRLSKKTQVSTLNLVNFYGKDFYYALISVDGQNAYCYVPKDFTVKTLSENPERFTFKVENINACTVYQDKDMQSEIESISAGTVRVFAIENGVAEIEYEHDGAWIHAFTGANNINAGDNTALRNALIIIAVSLCVFVSSLYLILRRKEK